VRASAVIECAFAESRAQKYESDGDMSRFVLSPDGGRQKWNQRRASGAPGQFLCRKRVDYRQTEPGTSCCARCRRHVIALVV